MFLQRIQLAIASHQRLVLVLAVVAMAPPVYRLATTLPALIWKDGEGARDLEKRVVETQRWFSGQPVYGAFARGGDYPPASYAILWPLLGWLDYGTCRWIWAIASLAALGWLGITLARESRTTSPALAALWVLLPFASYPAASTMFKGQLPALVVAILLAGLLRLRDLRNTWWGDLTLASVFVFALVKPTVSAPFFWMVCFFPGRIRPMLLVIGLYASLFLLAASFQESRLDVLVAQWLEQAERNVDVESGHMNLSRWLHEVGWGSWDSAASLVALGCLGIWVFRHRRGDIWILTGVSAFVARIWTHHRRTDDLLMLLLMMALYRMAMRHETTLLRRRLMDITLFAAWVLMLIPNGLFNLPDPVPMILAVLLTAVWVTGFALLVEVGRNSQFETAIVGPRGADA